VHNIKTRYFRVQFISVAQSCPTLWDPHGPQHTRPPGPSPPPGAYSNSCSSSQWCHPAISSSVVPFSSCLQSFPASGSFQMSQFFESGGQNIGVSPSASVLPMNSQDWFPLGWIAWISLQSKGLSRVFFEYYSSKVSILQHSAFFIVQLSHPYMTTGKTIVLARQTFVGKVMSLLFNMLSRLVMEKEMATHSSVLAWRIPGAVEPGGLPSVGSHRVRHDWSDLAAVAAGWS